jgi:uncharacterized protein (DUF885 family)
MLVCIGSCASPAGPRSPAHESGSASAAAPGAELDDAAISQAESDYLALLVAISPETATALGVHSRDTELDPYSLDEEEAGLRREEAMLADLKRRFAQPHASLSKRIDLALIESALAVDVRIRRTTKPLERCPDTYADPMNVLVVMSEHEYAPAAERARASLARIEKVPEVVMLGRRNLGKAPHVWIRIGLDKARGARQFFADERTFLEGALPAERTRIAAAIDGAVEAYDKYAAYLEHRLGPREPWGGGKDPAESFAAGRDLYSFLLREGFFLAEDADALYEDGRRVFERTEAQLQALSRRIEPNAQGWAEVVRRLKKHHPTAADLLPSYRREVLRARQFLQGKDVVPFPPGDDCVVAETPPFLRSTETASYEPAAPLDPDTRGFFFVTPVDERASAKEQEELLEEHDHGDQVDTVTHETYPGHHLQLSLARGYPSLVRKMTDAKRAALIGQDAFTEGWALYAEELMNELGYYTEEERLIQLQWTLVRAARVMIDVGLHTRGMKFEEATAFLTDRVHLEPSLAESEIKRYTMSPTQPLSYLIGRERILAMRERYRTRVPGPFSLKAFHTELLSHGAMAPGLIEREMFE